MKATAMNRETNVYRAEHVQTGKMWYAVASYRDGRYYSSLTDRERRLNGGNQWFGPFGYVAFYTNEESARQRARREYGYSQIENATANLGQGFETIS